ncbi:maleylpyruvate isomerase family mycothiol-dependent enzyme [Streptacidiphilus cavernicola]|uniref:Maleylpyruvate isomerase family mycothiol-dependent enzyme n=1 Tax=Streptacidiphilus cavernicola TaxID=3342716 RepID=A0ABV6W6G4_9ACTN
MTATTAGAAGVAAFDHGRYLAAMEAEARSFAAAVARGDLAARVPSCPDWDLAELVRHQGLVHRWVTKIVRSGTRQRVDWSDLPDRARPDDPAGQADWLLRGSLVLVGLLREQGPDTEVWGWAREQHTGWWARRMAHELLVHRIDAELAVDGIGPVDPELAADSIDELLHNAGAPSANAFPRREKLRGEGGTLHLHCTDVPGEWLLRRTPDGFGYEPGHAKGDAVLRGPAAELMLLLNKRLPDGAGAVECLGDAELAELWLDGLTFD